MTASASLRDEERALPAPRRETHIPSGVLSPNTTDDVTELQIRRDGNGDGAGEGEGFLRRKTSQLLEVISLSTAHGSEPGPILMPHIAALVDSYATSNIAAAIRADIHSVAHPAQVPDGSEELPDVAAESTLLRGRKRATWSTQFRILSGRAFKNMYRDPALLAFQYSASIAAARESDWLSMTYPFLIPIPQCSVDCSTTTCPMILEDSKIDWVRDPGDM